MKVHPNTLNPAMPSPSDWAGPPAAGHADGPQARLSEPLPRPAEPDRHAGRHRVLRRAGSRAVRHLPRLREPHRRHVRPRDRPTFGSCPRHQELRRPVPARRPRAAPDPVHARRQRRAGAGGRLRQLEEARAAAPPRRCWSAPMRPSGNSLPWDITQGSIAALAAPSAVAVDDTYFGELGIERSSATGRGQQHPGDRRRRHARHPLVHHAALRVHHARHRAHAASTQPPIRPPTRWSRSPPAATPKPCARRSRPACRTPRSSPTHEFRKRSLDYWLFETGAGAALIAGAAARHHRRHRHRRPDALRQHQGPPERIRHPARARRLGRLHHQGHPDAGDAQRGHRLRPRHAAELRRRSGSRARPRC